MRIGVFPVLERNSGGVYQYSLTLLDSLGQLQQQGLSDEFLLFREMNPTDEATQRMVQLDWPSITIPQAGNHFSPEKYMPGLLDRIRATVGEGAHRDAWRRLRDKLQPGWRYRPFHQQNPDKILLRPDVAAILREHAIDFALFPAPCSLGFESGIPFVMAVHDLQHRIQPEFPEVSANGEWQRREYLFRNAARHAMLLIADSEIGKEDILTYYGQYGVKSDRVVVLPFLPAHYLPQYVAPPECSAVLARYGVVGPYLFYPAQFWPHKNHVRIVEAVGLLKQRQNLAIQVVFSGSHAGEVREQVFERTKETARRYQIEPQIHWLGYVPETEIAAFFAGAQALIMPTFFGPTNIPPLEAWSLGCPVITSDIRGIREQMGDAALLVNPHSVESIADAILRVWGNEQLRQGLIARGRARLGSYTPAEFRDRLKDLLEAGKEALHVAR
jgi:glycosyltransferase involved in cell wall biosynthesis